MSTKTRTKKQLPPGKVGLGNKLAFACGDIFGGGSFNIINFLFTPFLTLVVGIPMVYLTPILLLTKIWDGIIDPFIGKITDAKRPGKFGKRRFFMLIFAPLVLVGFVLLFFPWNLIIDQVWAKCLLVVMVYMLYATAQSFVLIPYYSHASEMTDDFTERNRTNAVRLAFSILSSLICVAVPGMIASPTEPAVFKDNPSLSYIVMAATFGGIFMVSVLVAALFSREQVVTPAVKSKFDIKEFVRPLKMATYRRYLGMQMCASFGMAVMSSFFFTLCDFVLRRNTYLAVNLNGDLSRFPIATVALPIYLTIIKKKSKRFAYITGAIVWIVVAAFMLFLPVEQEIKVGASTFLPSAETVKGLSGSISTANGAPNWLLIGFGLCLGLGIGGTVFVPHSAFGDVCDVGELYFGERTEGNFSGLNNFLNTTAQAVGLAIPPLIIGLTGYVETQYRTAEQYRDLLGMSPEEQIENLGMALDNFKITEGGGNVQFSPLSQPEAAQIAIKLTFILLPIIIVGLGIIISSRYKLTSKLQARIVALNRRADKNSDEWQAERKELLGALGENIDKLPEVGAQQAESEQTEDLTATTSQSDSEQTADTPTETVAPQTAGTTADDRQDGDKD